MILSCENRDLVEYDGITYELVEKRNIYDGSVDQYYRVESVPRDWTEVTIPDKIDKFEVRNIGEGAFMNCTNLKSVSLPDGITYIDDYAFENCTSLTELKLPKEIEHVGGGAVIGCTNLNKISIDENNPYFKVIDNTLYSKDGLEFILYPSGKREEHFKILEGVTIIEDYAFYGACLESVEIPYGVESICNDAFRGCRNLNSIELPDSVKYLDYYVFYSCDNLKSVVLSKNLKEIPQKTFYNCRSLESISIPNSIESIQGEAFMHCTSLRSIFIPNTVQEINFRAFQSCDNLTVYCEAEIKPQKWESSWYGNATVVWGATAPNEE